MIAHAQGPQADQPTREPIADVASSTTQQFLEPIYVPTPTRKIGQDSTRQSRRALWESVITEAANRHGVPAGIMIEIAGCESGWDPTRWNYMNPKGDPTSKWSAYGMFQVIASHERRFGISRMTVEGNIEIVMRLYVANIAKGGPGTTDWNESRSCWGK